jgi:hypothetical protein
VTTAGRWTTAYPGLGIIVLDPSTTREQFAERLRRVDGWDRIAIIGPYGHGTDVMPDATGLNPWLSASVASTFGMMQDGIYKALVISRGRVAATLYLENVPFAAVIERSP